jgi:hypothetical protein
MSTNLKKDLDHLSELIRKANELINPENDLSYLIKKDIRDRLYGEKPKCFIKILPIGRDTSPYLLPICNRQGIEDAKVIKVSIKVIEKLMSNENGKFDVNMLQTVLNKLNHHDSVFSKQIPKPMSTGAQKAKVTRMFGNIKKYLDLTKTSAIGEE